MKEQSNMVHAQRPGGYIPVLDILRGVAILMVLMLHFYNEAIINEGYPVIGPIITKLALSGLYGVELFFVISGFLITQILLDSKNDPHYFRNFYVRRFLRIFPLYWLVLFLVFFIVPRIVPFDEAAKDIASRQVWLWTCLSNAPWSGGHWDSSGLFRLGHFWFICVVVHFYIIWPLVVGRCEPRAIVTVCVIGICICLITRTITAVTGGPELFAWSSIRKMDGMFFGSLLAAGLRFEPVKSQIIKYAPKAAWMAGILFLVLIFVPRRLGRGINQNIGYYWIVMETVSVVFFGGVLICLLQKEIGKYKTVLNRFLSVIGKYSFGMFVIHNICWQLFQWLFKPVDLSKGLGSPLLAQAIYYGLTISVSFCAAFVSWHVYEKHLLKLKRLFEHRLYPDKIKVSTSEYN